MTNSAKKNLPRREEKAFTRREKRQLKHKVKIYENSSIAKSYEN